MIGGVMGRVGGGILTLFLASYRGEKC